MPNALRLVSPLLALAVALPAAEAKAPAAKPKPVDYQANLALVPASDPAPAKPTALAPGMAGQHPRLLFTAAEVAALAQAAQRDPVLKEAVADTLAAASIYPLGKGRPDFISDDTPAIWKAGGTYPGLAYAYHLGKDAKVRQKIIDILTTMLAQPYWADSQELDCNMGAGNNMLMTGILFDAVAPDLEPAFRAKMAAKILVHARRMWYLGHQQKAVGTIKYWQQDPQNNHRWHRDAGMAACLTAIADEPGLDCAWLIEQFRGEMDFIFQWLPKDGDCHEGTAYQAFGFGRLALAARMMDRVLGTDYQHHPALHNAWAQRIYYWAPGRTGNMSFGDDANFESVAFDRDDAAFFIGPQLSHDPLAQAALVFRMQSMRTMKPGPLPWQMLAFYDPALAGGDHLALPTNRLFPDLGAASLRDSWKPEAVALTVKCGPYGGYRLNAFAWRNADKPTYVNVAHDDPDANSFALAIDGDLVFHPGLYSMPKLTESNSTLLVDGKGQINEGSDYTQPVGGTDMRTLSYLTGWKAGEHGRTIIEGEAGKAYPKRLTGFRRTTVWMPGDYVLILDDVAAEQPHSITWVGVAAKAAIADPATGTATASGAKGKSVGVQVIGSAPLQAEVKPLHVLARWGNGDFQQLRYTAEAATLRIAGVLDPWGTKPVVAMTEDKGVATVTVTHGGSTDTWTWQRAADAKTPSQVVGTRSGSPLIALTPADIAPHGD